MTEHPVMDMYPLSPMQKGMLFHSAYESNGIYHVQFGWDLTGPLDVAALVRAWNELLHRHPILRTGFVWEDLEESLQVVYRTVELPFVEEDWRGLTAAEQAERLRQYMNADRADLFVLDEPPLLRLRLIRLADERYRLIWSLHHLLLDGWSIATLSREVFALYEAFHKGLPSPLPPVRPFRDHIAWLKRQDRARAEAFWKETLQGFTSPTPIAGSSTSGSDGDGSANHAELEIRLTAGESTALQAWAKRHRLTLNTLVQGAWSLLLSHYSGHDDILYGVTVSGRPVDLPGMESMVGLFINTLPLRVQVAPDLSVTDWLHALQVRLAEVTRYDYVSLVHIQGWSEVPRGPSLFDSIVVFENFPADGLLPQPADLQVTPLEVVQRTNYPLTLMVVPEGELRLHLYYDSQRFDGETAHRMLGHLRTLLPALASDPERPVKAVSPLPEDEARLLLQEFNRTAVENPRELLVHQLVAQQAEMAPEAVALVQGTRTWTYGELERRTNSLAHRLQALGVGPETVAGVCVHRSPEMVAGQLAIFKAGGAYMPMDPAYPDDRLAFMLADAGATVLLTESSMAPRFASQAVRLIFLDEPEPLSGADDSAPPAVTLTGENLAYVIYTSGSTGRPKGVEVEHRNLLNLIYWHRRAFEVTHEDRATQLAGPAFDAAVWETWPYLTAGASLHFADEETRLSPELVRTWLTAQSITISFLPTPLAQAVLRLDWSANRRLRLLLTGGDKLQAGPPESLPFRLVNNYGPTENTVVTTYCVVPPAGSDRSLPPIGRPVENARIYLLDRQMRPVPLGIPGELCISGESLARGYRGRPELTAERFVANPFEPGQRLYRTGDLARYRADGTLEFMGRIDNQVKIRGFRIELGEIEAVLLQHPAVKEAAVIDREAGRGEKQLVGYLAAGEGGRPSVRELRGFLERTLPDYMVPAVFHWLDGLPMTPNGKVDRRALPVLDLEADLSAVEESQPPATPTEAMVARVWADALAVANIGRNDSFFALGGHSLAATAVTAKLREETGLELPVQLIFRHPTLAELASAIDGLQGGSGHTPGIESAIDLASEVQLDADIVVDGTPAPAGDTRTILLTGASGFLGAFLVRELYRRTQAGIYCLVRADNQEHARERIEKNLKRYGLWDPEMSVRLFPVVGDLSQPGLGLSQAEFDHLAQNVDLILHNGAAVNFMQPYEGLKAANVQGTQALLRLAVSNHLKPFHYISTLSVFSAADFLELGAPRETDWPTRWEALQGGYPQSKWVAEQIVRQAGDRGIPVAIYRLGRISGDSQTGACQTDDALWQFLRICISLGEIPDVETPIELLPADWTAAAVVGLINQGTAIGQTFHLVNPNLISAQRLAEALQQRGFDLKPLPPDRWQESLARQVADAPADSPLALGQLLFENSLGEEGGSLDCVATLRALSGTGLVPPVIDQDVLGTYIDYFVQSGYFPAPLGVRR